MVLVCLNDFLPGRLFLTSFLDGFISSFKPEVSELNLKISGMMLELINPAGAPPPDFNCNSDLSGSCLTVSAFTVSNKSSKKEDCGAGAAASRFMTLSSYPVLVLLIDGLVKN